MENKFGFEVVQNKQGTLFFLLDVVDGLKVKFFGTEFETLKGAEFWKTARAKKVGKELSPVKKGIKDGKEMFMYSISTDNFKLEISANGKVETLKIYNGATEWL